MMRYGFAVPIDNDAAFRVEADVAVRIDEDFLAPGVLDCVPAFPDDPPRTGFGPGAASVEVDNTGKAIALSRGLCRTAAWAGGLGTTQTVGAPAEHTRIALFTRNPPEIFRSDGKVR